ncbi:N-acetylglucosamine-6-phosphate deacetylase [Parenemella sanctibonifatiensis]|uniref:N-acetylglucosamine-6-phosphate deacetylase n=1 Tax=Parenemella sanctibonifatiensis TaxID=2016505 RepID=A0A255ELM9_9ACTN|nr:N-acetylglucosamine-6-phosphate deacetylase [Parenemella sanctibonifatiensis]OYN92448.1 N-acetylglucosamine-6-phosphate deacetylase [Parenemella sanctibonifatiensis]
MILSAEHVVTPEGVLTDAEIVVDGDRIAAIRPTSNPEPGWLVPGFIDTHCHGGAGFDFGDDPEPGLAYHRRGGTTSLFASLVTTSVDRLLTQIRSLVPLVQAGELAGIHLEGPFLSEARCGAHDPGLLIDPTDEVVAEILAAGQGCITMVTMDPVRANAAAATRTFREAGVQVAFGHSDADLDQTRAGIDAGMQVVTHLFNAMRSIHHREPGPVPLLLNDPRVAGLEVICDGFHLNLEVVTMAARAAGSDRILLITDAVGAAGMPDGPFQLGGLPANITDGKVRLVKDDGSFGSIAGSTLTMAQAFANVASVLPLETVVRMAASNPARVHGLSDVGELAVGKFADLCRVDPTGQLLAVHRHGEEIPLS